MTVEDALVLLDKMLQGQKLRDVQEQVFRYSWQGWTYPTIADHLGYDTGHIRDVGSQLWRQLGQAMGELVTKKNLQGVLRRYAQRQSESPKDEQVHRLLDLEKQILYWLAVHQEWASLTALRDDCVPLSSPSTLLGAMLSLRQRSLIDKSAASFTLEPVVMKYFMDQLLNRIETEVETECDRG